MDKIKCTRKCSCENCENCLPDWPIVFIKQGLNGSRTEKNGYKCTYYGHCAETKQKLKSGGYLDDVIFL